SNRNFSISDKSPYQLDRSQYFIKKNRRLRISFGGLFLFISCFLWSVSSWGSSILIPMDAEGQKNHLKAYGITYWVLAKEQNVQWLLNYRGGSFLLPD